MTHGLRLAVGSVVFMLIALVLRALAIIGMFLDTYGLDILLLLIGVLGVMTMYLAGWMLLDHVKEWFE